MNIVGDLIKKDKFEEVNNQTKFCKLVNFSDNRIIFEYHGQAILTLESLEDTVFYKFIVNINDTEISYSTRVSSNYHLFDAICHSLQLLEHHIDYRLDKYSIDSYVERNIMTDDDNDETKELKIIFRDFKYLQNLHN